MLLVAMKAAAKKLQPRRRAYFALTGNETGLATSDATLQLWVRFMIDKIASLTMVRSCHGTYILDNLDNPKRSFMKKPLIVLSIILKHWPASFVLGADGIRTRCF